MSEHENNRKPAKDGQHIVDAAIKVTFLGLIIVWCFLIFKPFVTLIFWSIIIAVSAYPFFKKMTKWFGGREKVASAVFVIIGIAVILVPGIGLTGSIVNTGKTVTADLSDGSLNFESPPESVKEWPIVGEPIFNLWSGAAANLEKTVEEYHEQLLPAVGWLLKSLAGIGLDLVLTIFAIIIAGLLMLNAESANEASIAFFERIVGRNGREYSDSSRDTMRSVVKGVVLVALVQSALAWVGFAVIGLPAAGVWAITVLFLAIIQLPPLIVIIPIIIYVFSYATTGAAIAFAVWGVLVSLSDSLMKPIFFGRGLKTPMLVILIGSLGGMMLHGILGLFIGAVVLALGFSLYKSWIRNWAPEEDVAELK